VLARIEEMDARLRFADVLSGLFFILGLAGMALWALGRRR
jgi:nickel transport protein